MKTSLSLFVQLFAFQYILIKPTYIKIHLLIFLPQIQYIINKKFEYLAIDFILSRKSYILFDSTEPVWIKMALLCGRRIEVQLRKNGRKSNVVRSMNTKHWNFVHKLNWCTKISQMMANGQFAWNLLALYYIQRKHNNSNKLRRTFRDFQHNRT